MPDFRLVAPFEPTGDQPAAIDRLSDGLARGLRHQTLLGATGTGKTYTIASAIARHNRPTLVLAHNKTLAAQLYAEFREFFPENAVEYFVSYFDYYQPEAYLPRSDTYIEKDSSRNDEIDRLRHAATHALFERRDVIIVASVSCIYGLGAPVDYGATVLKLRTGGKYRRDAVLRHLVDLQYQRNDAALSRSRFRVRGDTLEIGPASEDHVVRWRRRAASSARPSASIWPTRTSISSSIALIAAPSLSLGVTKCVAGKTLSSLRSASSSPVSGSSSVIRSTSSPKNSTRTISSELAGPISSVSPRTRNRARDSAASLRWYCRSTRCRSTASRRYWPPTRSRSTVAP